MFWFLIYFIYLISHLSHLSFWFGFRPSPVVIAAHPGELQGAGPHHQRGEDGAQLRVAQYRVVRVVKPDTWRSEAIAYRAGHDMCIHNFNVNLMKYTNVVHYK